VGPCQLEVGSFELGALSLYLDFTNMFMMFLRRHSRFGTCRDDRCLVQPA
jgi:hypothetical protein